MAITPRVTVITTAYNVARYIGEAVDSVLRQEFRDFEYIVVDDGSGDNTVDVAQESGGDDRRFRLIEAAHQGPSAARNLGINEARGAYVAFLDGDDRWHPRFLKEQVALLESLPAEVGVVFCRSRMMLENGTLVGVQRQRAGRYDFDDFLIGNNPARNGSSLLIRRSCFDDVGGFDEGKPGVEDLDMWLRIISGSKTPVFWASGHYLVDLRLRPGSITRDRSSMYAALLALIDEQVPRLRRKPAALAYTYPALAALKYGDSGDDLAEELAARARAAGIFRLASSITGCRLLLWSSLPRPARQRVRAVQHGAREAVKTVNLRVRGNGLGIYPRKHPHGMRVDSTLWQNPRIGPEKEQNTRYAYP